MSFTTDSLVKEYSNITKKVLPSKTFENKFIYSFIHGAKCEIFGPLEKEYIIKFIDKDKNELIFETVSKNNHWHKPNIEYFINWRIEVYDKETNELLDSHDFDAEDKNVFITLDSSAIGDTLAWLPVIKQFEEKHKCKIIISTFHNDWFYKEYPEWEFVSPGMQAFDIYALYCLGWFYNDQQIELHKNPQEVKNLPLQQTASDILGLEYKESKPRISTPKKDRPVEEKYVCIAPHASAHAKYWMYPGGWQTIIDYLNDKGYKVLMITHEVLGDKWHDSKLGGTLQNVIDKTGNGPLSDRINDIKHADLFIGLGSGLSWISWAVRTPTILISGFSAPHTEFQDCERIFTPDPDNTCNSCFNREWLNPGDWEWCPDHKDTDRHFECSKTIEPQTVINSINKFLKIS